MKYANITLFATFLVGVGVFWTHFQPRSSILENVQKMPALPTYIASKNGEVFGLPWCGSIPRVKTENILIFSHKIDAEKGGFRPIKNCKGL